MADGRCPECDAPCSTVDVHVEGYGHAKSASVKECNGCGILWAESREFVGLDP